MPSHCTIQQARAEIARRIGESPSYIWLWYHAPPCGDDGRVRIRADEIDTLIAEWMHSKHRRRRRSGGGDAG